MEPGKRKVRAMHYGYARVSTDGQTLEAQLEALKGAGAEKVFQEKASGAKRDRKELCRLLDALTTGDLVTVSRLDRLARSTRDLLNILAAIADKGAAFRSLADPWADTTTPHGRLMVTFLGGLAEFERELIRSRTTEGRHRAKARGVKLGPRFKLTPFQRQEVLDALDRGEATKADLARRFNVSGPTITRLVARGR